MRLGSVLRQYRWASKLDVRTLASEIGISTATLSRIERGNALDGKSLIKILEWLFEEITP